jgi:glutamate N-acetyltransferase/amino-acid N-acetyltransferase
MIKKELMHIEGFIGNTVHSGVKYKNPDLSLIFSTIPCIAAGTFTKNLTIAAPLIVTKAHLDNPIQALLVNSGNANAATGTQGYEDALATCSHVAKTLGISASQVLVSSTGVIGVPMPMEKIESGIAKVSTNLTSENFKKIPKAMMTTDTFEKYGSLSIEIDGDIVTFNGMAKGSGMIHPNMATMLSFLTTNANISKEMLQKALSEVVEDTFNMISVDGDTSTNDMVIILSNQTAQHPLIDSETESYQIIKSAVHELLEYLSIEIAKDGEGASKLLSVHLTQAPSKKDARTAAKSVITSSLVKSAFFGEDANWGRILSSLGASGATLDPKKVDLYFESSKGKIQLMDNGQPVLFSEEIAAKILSENEILIHINLNMGVASAKAWGCDLTYDYVKINADYRS